MKIKKSREPLEVDDDNWIYHFWKEHIELIHQVREKTTGLVQQVDHIKIPRKIIEKIWDDHDV